MEQEVKEAEEAETQAAILCPHNDTVCVQEFCYNYEICFITKRPVQPEREAA